MPKALEATKNVRARAVIGGPAPKEVKRIIDDRQLRKTELSSPRSRIFVYGMPLSIVRMPVRSPMTVAAWALVILQT